MSTDRERDRATAVDTCLALERGRFIPLDLGVEAKLIGASVQHGVFYVELNDTLWHFHLPDKQTALGHRKLHYDPRFLTVDSFTALVWGLHSDGDQAVPAPNYSKRRAAAPCLFAVNACDTLATTEAFASGRDFNACAGCTRFAALTDPKGEVTVWNGSVDKNDTITFKIVQRFSCGANAILSLAGHALIVDVYNNVWSTLPLITERPCRVWLHQPRHEARDVQIGNIWASPNAATVASTRFGTWRHCLLMWSRVAVTGKWHVAMVVPDEDRAARQLRVHYFSLPPALSATLDNDRGCMCLYPTRSGDETGVSVFQLPAL